MIAFIKAIIRRLLTKERAEVGMAMCGLVALVTPLLLWISWSPEMLKGILAMGFASFLLATWFAQYACPEALDPDQEVLPKPGEIPLSNIKGPASSLFLTKDALENQKNTQRITGREVKK